MVTGNSQDATHTAFQATLNQMLSAIFSRMENKTIEIEEMEKVTSEAQVLNTFNYSKKYAISRSMYGL